MPKQEDKPDYLSIPQLKGYVPSIVPEESPLAEAKRKLQWRQEQWKNK